jgi:hypothetical protein
MRHRRHGYLAAAGVGTSMVAGFALALLVVSAVIGFRGWPTSNVTSPSRVSVLPATGSSAAPAFTRAVGRVVLPAARVPARIAPARTRGSGLPAARRPVAGPSRPPAPAVIPSRPAVDPTPKTSASPAPTTVTAAPAGPTAPVSGDGVRRTTQDAGATVQQATQQTAQAVAPVAPAAGGAVQATGQAVADAITSTGETLGGVLDALTPKGP